MTVVERYITRRMLGIFLTTLVWVLAIVWTTQVLIRIDIVTSDGQSVWTFFQVAGLVLPAVVPVVMPFALGIAVAHTLATMNSDSELVVLAAAGTPRATIIRPAVLIAIFACLASFLIDNMVEPHSRTRLRELVAEARTALVTSIIREGAFHKIDDGLMLQIAQRLPDGQFRGIFVADDRDEKVSLIYYADRGAAVQAMGQQLLVMQDGVIQRKDAQGSISTVQYSTYAFDLSEFTSSSGQVTLHPKDRTLAYLMNPDPQDRIYQDRPQAFRGELHRRLTEWLYPLIFALIGLAVAGDARSHREARFHPLVTTMGFALVVRWAGFYVANEAATKAAFVPLLYAVPLVALVGLVFMLATNRALEPPSFLAERAGSLVAAVHERLASMSIFGRRGRAAGSAP